MIYDNIKEVCKKNGVAIRILESDLGLSQGSVCKWNSVSPSVASIKKVADYLGVTIDELISDKVS